MARLKSYSRVLFHALKSNGLHNLKQDRRILTIAEQQLIIILERRKWERVWE